MLISDHELYQRLGHHPEARQFAYRELFRHQPSGQDIHAIRESLTYNYPLGNDRFREQVEPALGRKVGRSSEGGRSDRMKLLKIKSLPPLMSGTVAVTPYMRRSA